MADPSGVDLCSGTTNGNTIPDYTSSWEEREITFDTPYELTSGNEYAIVIRAEAGDLDWLEKDNVYANGVAKYSDDSGSSWSDDGTYDMWFKTKASGVEKDTNTFAEEANWGYDITATDWDAQTFAASSTYTISSVVLKLGKFPATTPGTVTVSIQATGGVADKATNPSPSDAATDVTLDQATVSWTAGDGATSHDVYYGDTSGDLALLESGIEDTEYTISGITDGSPFEYVVTRYWRIDEVNETGTTTGDEWSFTTIRFDPPSKTVWYSTGGYYYRLLPQSDGTYGDSPADGGVENTDYEILAGYLPNFINTNRRLVAATRNSIYYEDI